MATITLQLQVATTVSALDGPSIAAVIAWVQNNIIKNLPPTATVTVQNYQVVP